MGSIVNMVKVARNFITCAYCGFLCIFLYRDYFLYNNYFHLNGIEQPRFQGFLSCFEKEPWSRGNVCQ